MPHSVVGHRMWRAATASVRKERFLALDEIHWLDNETAREIWLKLYVRRDNLQSHGRGVTETLREARIDSAFRAVNDAYAAAHDFHAFEQVVATPYTGRASDVVMETVANVRRDIWQTVTSTRPFRRFYLYLSPLGEFRLPQWVSTYSLLFWLGSLTRYQPVELLEALTGAYGPFFEEFIETQLAQLLYFLASEARAQDISKPALVWVYLTRASPEPIDASNADRRHYARLPPTFPARPHPSLRQIADTRHPREVADGVDEESCVANFPYTPRLGPSDAPAFSGARALIAHPVLYRDVRFSCNHRQMQPRTRDARRLG